MKTHGRNNDEVMRLIRRVFEEILTVVDRERVTPLILGGGLLLIGFCAIMALGDQRVVEAGVLDAGQRYSVNADMTIGDGRTGLLWARDAGTRTVESCIGGKKTWDEALAYIGCLNTRNYLGHSDWRLPTSEELTHLGTGTLSENETIASRLNSQGFIGVQAAFYWSSSVGVDDVAVAVDMLWDGNGHPMGKASACYLLPVRTP